ncbi:MAG: hypothetical protein ACLFPS_05760 [Clostridia bacterium]
MNFIKAEMDKDFKALGLKNQRRTVRVLDQVAKSNTDKKIDRARKALAPGKRISKTGKVYWETRANRSDKVGSNI